MKLLWNLNECSRISWRLLTPLPNIFKMLRDRLCFLSQCMGKHHQIWMTARYNAIKAAVVPLKSIISLKASILTLLVVSVDSSNVPYLHKVVLHPEARF